MRITRVVGGIVALVMSTGCNFWSVHRDGPFGSVVPPVGLTSTIQFESNKPEQVLNVTAPGEAPDTRLYSIFRVRNTNGQRTNLTVRVSKNARPMSDNEWDGRNIPITTRVTGGFDLPLREIDGRIDNRRLIQLTVSRVNAGGTIQDSAVYHLRYVKRWRWWNGISSPVLYRAVGNLGEFGLSNFAPSIAGGPRSYFGGGDNEFIGLNGMITVFQSTENVDRPFSAAAGGIVDFGGYVQVGVNYHFKDRRGFLVIGVRPEVWTPK